jgi:hypothetical protein
MLTEALALGETDINWDSWTTCGDSVGLLSVSSQRPPSHMSNAMINAMTIFHSRRGRSKMYLVGFFIALIIVLIIDITGRMAAAVFSWHEL